jgi:predicted O-methyltransferase YrrM
MDRIRKLEEYAKINNIPIMEKEGILFLLSLIKENKVIFILEIGSAIGYSAINMALINKNIKITTIERDTKRYNEALKNIEEFNLNDQINIINIDANLYEDNDKYDLIFIDAAKSQYINFFNKYKNNLNDNGIIVTDNLKFHNLLEEENLSKNVKGIVRKIKSYVDFLNNHEEYDTMFYNIGDGVSVTRKKVI